MADKDPVVQIQELPYMGPPKDTQKEKEEKRAQKAMPVTEGGRVTPKAPAHLKKGGKIRTASQRADGCCIRGKTRA